MQRIAFLMSVKPGYEEEYKRRHDDIWPEMLEALQRAGAHNYSIFRHGTQLFAYLETDDFERLAKTLAADPTNQRWQQWMAEIMTQELDPQTQWPPLLPEMFHMD
ncbi:MAG: L-rhamnose mutarotase [Thermogemmatispora sp.]|uniref:L-rhamnose mutarotase n=1 Tax=Thermogemmatispora sp. TaxID=1968838 RepID=UPI001A0AFF19|nr:L-rhamnose mutarotase [Thermogemmatispora sp.]MBE3564948.1 L-rhamnose mutarotase [Thermogemmatispora sp.]